MALLQKWSDEGLLAKAGFSNSLGSAPEIGTDDAGDGHLGFNIDPNKNPHGPSKNVIGHHSDKLSGWIKRAHSNSAHPSKEIQELFNGLPAKKIAEVVTHISKKTKKGKKNKYLDQSKYTKSALEAELKKQEKALKALIADIKQKFDDGTYKISVTGAPLAISGVKLFSERTRTHSFETAITSERILKQGIIDSLKQSNGGKYVRIARISNPKHADDLPFDVLVGLAYTNLLDLAVSYYKITAKNPVEQTKVKLTDMKESLKTIKKTKREISSIKEAHHKFEPLKK